MLNIITKVNDDPSQADGILTAEEFNSGTNELKNAVTSSGQTLTGEDNFQLAKAMTNHTLVASSFLDSGSINTYTLTAQGAFRPPSSYLDAMKIRFFPGNANTGPSTVNIQGIGAQPIRRLDGSNLQANDITVGAEIELTYRSSLGYFILSQNVKTSGNQTVFDKKTFATTPSASSDPVSSTDLVRLSFLQSYVTANAQSALPPGVPVPYSGSTAPSGYIFPAGQAVSRTTFAALFAVTGTNFGSGDGSTTFNVPDLRGRAPFGKDDMGGSAANRLTGNGVVLGGVGGSATKTLVVNELPPHSHDTNLFSSAGSGIAANGSNNGNVATQTGLTGNGQAFSILPPYLVLNYILKV